MYISHHHYAQRLITISVIILVLIGSVMLMDIVSAQQMVVIKLPTSYEVTPIIQSNSSSGTLALSVPITATTTTDTNSSGSLITTGAKSDPAIIYARKIETLITVKGQETRLNMIEIMRKFLLKYDPSQPLYGTITDIMNIIKLGDVAHKLEYCTQFDDSYILDLFGQEMDLYSTIKYSNTFRRCEMTFQYPDSSVHTCRLDDSEKLLLSQMLINKQGLTESTSTQTFESILEGYLKQTICFESQKAKAKIAVVSTGSIVATGSSTSGEDSATWWKFGK